MKWNKINKIYNFEKINDKLLSHASNPLAVLLRDDLYRVFFSGRNYENKSSVGYVDIDLSSMTVKNICDKEIFAFGTENSFYSHGVSIGNMYKIENKEYILFMGWQIRNGGHWRGDIGRLFINDDYSKMIIDPEAPFLESDDNDPISLSYPWVMKEGDLYRMWYGSTVTWDGGNEEMVHIIKYAESFDGITWSKFNDFIPYELGIAQAFSRPSVIKFNDHYHMWYSFRAGDGTKYRIGYAVSTDGRKWKREDDSGINVSDSGWDSEMICYPFVFEHKNEIYMLYNGNNYGKEGFGIAVLEKESV